MSGPVHALSPMTAVRGLMVLFALLAACAAPAHVLAAGEEHTTNSDDLIVQTDSRWAGAANGGYLPVRVTVINRGEPRELAFELAAERGSHGVTVQKMIAIDPNAAVRFTLAVPTMNGSGASLRVLDRGIELKGHTHYLSTSSFARLAVVPPALLVVTQSVVETGRYVEAANQLVKPVAGGPWGTSPTAVDASLIAAQVPPSQLPDSWIDYSALDLVAISRDELERLERPAASALWKWVQCGGNLVVYDVGHGADALKKLDTLLALPDQAGAPEPWNTSKLALRAIIPSAAPGRESGSAAAKAATSPKRGPATSPGVTRPWPERTEVSVRPVMLGAVCAIPENPFPGSDGDWMWLLTLLSNNRYSWISRHGLSPQSGSADFFNFTNPGIHSVPTYAFLLLITVFAMAIGPVNYFYLQRKKMLWMLLVTVPVFAVLTSGLLFGYSVAVHGFSVKSRIRSLTVLDQRSRTAVSMARLALFAGVAPSNGLRFSPETEVIPIMPPSGEFGPALIDWTEGQALKSGWMPSRTRTQFLTLRNAEQRSRVEFKPANQGKVELGNGLPWDIEALVVCDDAHHLYFGEKIAANASAALAPAQKGDLKRFVGLLGRNEPEVPEGFVLPTAGPFRRGGVFFSGSRSPGQFQSNLMERRIADWKWLSQDKNPLVPRSYLAVLKQNPGIETGVERSTEEMGYHLLLGYY